MRHDPHHETLRHSRSKLDSPERGRDSRILRCISLVVACRRGGCLLVEGGVMTMFAIIKGKRMVEPAFNSRELADMVCAAYGKGYRVVICEVLV